MIKTIELVRFYVLIGWEIPRLCGGGSLGLTGPGISKSWALIVSSLRLCRRMIIPAGKISAVCKPLIW